MLVSCTQRRIVVIGHSSMPWLIVRMNFSHGSYDYHQSVIDNTRKMVACEFLYAAFHGASAERFLQPNLGVRLPLLLTRLVFSPHVRCAELMGRRRKDLRSARVL